MKSLLLASALTLAMIGSAQAATVTNGSFEEGVDPGSFTRLTNGSTGIAGWTVVGGSVDYIGTYWNASLGNRSIDLDGNSAGSIETTILDLIVGQTYNLFFDMSGNTDGDPIAKQLSVQFVNATILGTGLFTYNTVENGTLIPAMNWVEKSLQFVANATSATLRFVSGNGNPDRNFGAAVDNVRVSAAVIPLPATGLLAFAGLAGLALLRGRRKTA